MLAATQPVPVAKPTMWAGRIISALAILFLTVNSVIKVLNLAPAVEATTQLGYPERLVIGLGILELTCLAIYVIPRTSVLGAILLTGYLGGAIATPGARRFAAVFRRLPNHHRRADLGRALRARRPATRTHAAAKVGCTAGLCAP